MLKCPWNLFKGIVYQNFHLRQRENQNYHSVQNYPIRRMKIRLIGSSEENGNSGCLKLD